MKITDEYECRAFCTAGDLEVELDNNAGTPYVRLHGKQGRYAGGADEFDIWMDARDARRLGEHLLHASRCSDGP